MTTFRPIAFVTKARKRARRSTGFTLIELLVVVSIIALLIGLLLPALAAVNAKAKQTATLATINEFSKACDLFFLEHGFYPGVFDEADLAAGVGLSGTENALLHLMGGYLEPTDANYGAGVELIGPVTGKTIEILTNQIGTGPIINGVAYEPYYTPAQEELGVTDGQVNEALPFPDLLDAWGQPIVFIKRSRSIGPIVPDNSGVQPQFTLASAAPYLDSTILGELKEDQTVDSVLSASNTGTADGNNAMDKRDWNLAQLVGHQAMTTGSLANNDINFTATKGSYVLFSAGPDGIYFSRWDGFGSSTQEQLEIPGPVVVDEYDDVVVTGGGS